MDTGKAEMSDVEIGMGGAPFVVKVSLAVLSPRL
jgi:hypothetical protein